MLKFKTLKKEWIVFFIAFVVYYFSYIIDIHHKEIRISNFLIKDFFYLLYHVLLFVIVNQILIQRFFYKKKFFYFFVLTVLLIATFGLIEEGLVEKILYPNTKGIDPVNLLSAYWFFGEILIPLLSFTTLKILFDNIQNQKIITQKTNDSLNNELKFLKSQIQPHVLFNSLNNLYDYTLSKSDKAPALVLQLSNVLRYVLYETRADKVPINKEFDFIKEYIELQKTQLEGRGEVIFNITNTIKEDLKIAPFILIPFIENSFKHSLNTKEDNIQINIDILIKNKILTLLVENNYDKEHLYFEALIDEGIGLKNVKKRLELLYFNEYNLNIIENDNLYKIKLNLNLNNENI